ncbi:MAG: hypothetical protein Kow00103_05820 [Candidatus Caldatribacteriota bacterium]
MVEQKNKDEKTSKSFFWEKKINQGLIVILLIFMCTIIFLFFSFQQEIKILNSTLTEYMQKFNQDNEKLNSQFEHLYEEINKLKQVAVNRDQFTEIYMQLQELTGMISNEVKREFYITRIVKVISQHNQELRSEDIYEIAKTIYEESIKYDFNPLLLTALIKVESNFNPRAISDSYAYGLCQVRRFIAPELAEKLGISWEGAEKTLFDPVKNIKIGAYYLSILNRDFEDLDTAIIAYNQGPYAVQENLSSNNALNKNYLNKVLDYFSSLRGFNLEESPEEVKNNKN